jgi:hypothetical protein
LILARGVDWITQHWSDHALAMSALLVLGSRICYYKLSRLMYNGMVGTLLMEGGRRWVNFCSHFHSVSYISFSGIVKFVVLVNICWPWSWRKMQNKEEKAMSGHGTAMQWAAISFILLPGNVPAFTSDATNTAEYVINFKQRKLRL